LIIGWLQKRKGRTIDVLQSGCLIRIWFLFNPFHFKEDEKMKFIHLSDLHFHTFPEDNMKSTATLDFVGRNYLEHGVIVTGDIADDGKEEQFDAAFTSLSQFLGRIYICPGNHDFGAAGNFYSRERAERFDRMLSVPLKQGGTFTGDATPVVNILKDDTTEVMLIALDTNLETEHPFDFASGEVGDPQLASLNTILSAPDSADMVKILFFHHHPFMHNNPFMELEDARKLFRTVYSRVDLVLFGHKHVSGMWKNANGIFYILAADNSPGKDFAREIEVVGKTIAVRDVPIR
jgi:3',5'-cyclic AMP phosphodiesterase CpdA